MRYAYYFEFCEHSEMPEWLRGDLFLSLAWLQGAFGLKQILTSVVPKLIGLSGAKRLIELGSGSGDGLVCVADGMSQDSANCAFEMIATDKYPHVVIWNSKLANYSSVSWSEQPVGFEDFEQVLGGQVLKDGIILLVSAFHHMSPATAREFLERAAKSGASVLVIEPLERNLKGLILGGLTFVPALLFPIQVLRKNRPSFGRWIRLAVFHWIVPLIPFFLFHDGIVSAYRQRTSEDWDTLTLGLPFRTIARTKLGLMGNFSAILLEKYYL